MDFEKFSKFMQPIFKKCVFIGVMEGKSENKFSDSHFVASALRAPCRFAYSKPPQNSGYYRKEWSYT